MRRPALKSGTDDKKVFHAWLRGTIAIYGTIVLLCVGFILFRVFMNAPDVASYMGDATSQFAP
jgi:hypothetical protein